MNTLFYNHHNSTSYTHSSSISNYETKGTIGEGTFGKVKLGINKQTYEKVAIKILEKCKIQSNNDWERVQREINILSRLEHRNVIKIFELFEDKDNYYIIMEYCENGELFNHIVDEQRLSEEEASYFYYQLINGWEHIHQHEVVHRDWKPENLLIGKDNIWKIIDFGLSNYFSLGKLLSTPCGSPCYASPEMVSGKKYNGFNIDIWSTGIVLYAMVIGYLPFEDPENEKLFQKILECKWTYPSHVSNLVKSWLKKILVTDPEKRIKINKIKSHPFYLQGKKIFEIEHPEIVSEERTMVLEKEQHWEHEVVIEKERKVAIDKGDCMNIEEDRVKKGISINTEGNTNEISKKLDKPVIEINIMSTNDSNSHNYNLPLSPQQKLNDQIKKDDGVISKQIPSREKQGKFIDFNVAPRNVISQTNPNETLSKNVNQKSTRPKYWSISDISSSDKQHYRAYSVAKEQITETFSKKVTTKSNIRINTEHDYINYNISGKPTKPSFIQNNYITPNNVKERININRRTVSSGNSKCINNNQSPSIGSSQNRILTSFQRNVNNTFRGPNNTDLFNWNTNRDKRGTTVVNKTNKYTSEIVNNLNNKNNNITKVSLNYLSTGGEEGQKVAPKNKGINSIMITNDILTLNMYGKNHKLNSSNNPNRSTNPSFPLSNLVTNSNAFNKKQSINAIKTRNLNSLLKPSITNRRPVTAYSNIVTNNWSNHRRKEQKCQELKLEFSTSTSGNSSDINKMKNTTTLFNLIKDNPLYINTETKDIHRKSHSNKWNDIFYSGFERSKPQGKCNGMNYSVPKKKNNNNKITSCYIWGGTSNIVDNSAHNHHGSGTKDTNRISNLMNYLKNQRRNVYHK